MEPEPDHLMKIASIVVGPSTIYSRSRSSIHRHAMLVSLQRAAQNGSANDKVKHPDQPQQTRLKLMSRFSINESSKKRKRNTRYLDKSLTGMSLACRKEQSTRTTQMMAPRHSLMQQIHMQLFPHNVDPNQGLLMRLSETPSHSSVVPRSYL